MLDNEKKGVVFTERINKYLKDSGLGDSGDV